PDSTLVDTAVGRIVIVGVTVGMGVRVGFGVEEPVGVAVLLGVTEGESAGPTKIAKTEKPGLGVGEGAPLLPPLQLTRLITIAPKTNRAAERITSDRARIIIASDAMTVHRRAVKACA
ncbi:MAG TPA: hypothetical protein VMT58_00585, partial [Candidatus Binataceae bacterium]|nr:hypothetical protein [Candidatus Binataceae bacterium]